ncbi:hypothetical protein BGP_6649 [Beggiatoa sp. PS]|nr:hypothetical protein BGP_6649 [Beggiatoa sp. PS]
MKNVLIIISFLLMNGCNLPIKKPPTSIEKIANAELALMKAQDSNAPVLAPKEWQLAQQKLQQAKEAQQNQNDNKAIRLAEQALIDAQLAETKAELEMARQIFKKQHQTF